MLIYRKLHHSLDLMLEALDLGSPRLILEANAKFVEGVKGLKSSIEKFSKLVGEAGVEGLKPTYEALYKEVQELEGKLDEVPDSFSYKDQLKLLAASDDDAAPEAMVTKIALAHDANVTGMKDAIIEISKVLEGMKEVFSVGSKGIFLQPEFQKLTAKPEEVYLGMFGMPAENVLNALAGQDAPKGTDGYDEEELEQAKEHWAPIWNADGNQDDEKFNSFIEGFRKVGEGINKAYEAAGKAIQNAKPSPEFQDEAPKEGIMASLMGGIFGSMKGGSDIKADPKLIMGDDPYSEEGLLGIPFSKLSGLVSGLIEMSGNATEAATAAVKVVKDNQEEQTDPDEALKLKKYLIDKYDEKEGTPEDYPQAFKAMAAFEVIFKGAENVSMKAVKDKGPELKGLLSQVEIPKDETTTVKFEDDEIKRLLDILEIEAGEDEEEEEITPVEFDGKKHRTNELKDFIKSSLGANWGRDDVEFAFQVLKDEGLITLREGLRDSKADFKKEFLEKVKAKIEAGNMKPANKKKSLARFDDKALEVLWKYFKEKGVELNESVVFERWGVLAGIIKG